MSTPSYHILNRTAAPTSSPMIMIHKTQIQAESDTRKAEQGTYDDPENQPDPWTTKEVDLLNWHTNIAKYHPVFTRQVLENCLATRELIMSSSPEYHWHWERDFQGKSRCLWRRSSKDDNRIAVNYLTAIEMTPDSHVDPPVGVYRSPNVEHLHDINDLEDDNEFIFAPISYTTWDVINSVARLGAQDHEDKALMARWRSDIADARLLWDRSASKKNVCQRLEASLKVSITKIICFGLGRLERDDPERILQHLTVFDIASFLDAKQQSKDPNAPSIRVYLQDPMYNEKDRLLLQEAFSASCPESSPVSFPSDPEAFLEIDQDSFVVAPFLPITVPLYQICADLGYHGSKSPRAWPAGFLCDVINIQWTDATRKLWTAQERASPRVVSMLQNYTRDQFHEVGVERDFHRNCVSTHGLYWLWQMYLWLRKK